MPVHPPKAGAKPLPRSPLPPIRHLQSPRRALETRCGLVIAKLQQQHVAVVDDATPTVDDCGTCRTLKRWEAQP